LFQSADKIHEKKDPFLPRGVLKFKAPFCHHKSHDTLLLQKGTRASSTSRSTGRRRRSSRTTPPPPETRTLSRQARESYLPDRI